MHAQVLQSLVGALKLLAGSRAPPNSAGIELLLAARGDGDDAGAPNLATPNNQYVRHEACAAWGCMQARSTSGKCLCLIWPCPATSICATWPVPIGLVGMRASRPRMNRGSYCDVAIDMCCCRSAWDSTRRSRCTMAD